MTRVSLQAIGGPSYVKQPERSVVLAEAGVARGYMVHSQVLAPMVLEAHVMISSASLH